MAVTLKQIAHEAEVDVSVVSRVLNNKAKQARISEDRQFQIRGIAERLGYVPNVSAQAIRTGRFGCVAVLQSGYIYRSYMPSGLLDGIYHRLEERDMHVLLAKLPEGRLEEDSELPKIFRNLMADGVIVNYNHHLPEKIISAVKNSNMPAVWLNTKKTHNAVFADCVKGGYEATSKLTRLGHSKIAYVDIYFDNLKEDAHYSVNDRFQGYTQVMEDAGLTPCNMTPRKNIQNSMDDQVEYFRNLLSGPTRPTAIVLYWANSISSLLIAARQLNISVPDELSIITFASESFSEQGLSVSAMLEPENEMGREAVGLLYDLMESNGAEMPSRVVDFNFVDLGTIAPVKEVL